MCDTMNKKIQKWVDLALKNHDVFNYKIAIQGQTDKGDGYSGDIHFVKVTGFAKSGDEKTFNLAVKSCTENEKLREQAPIEDAYHKEIYIYDVVKATFEKFMQEKGIDELIDVMPRCYATLLTDTTEVLFFENLRPRGFELWDKERPMTFKHIKLVLEAYGRWHALSMALNTRKPDVFKKLVQNNVNMFTQVIVKAKFDVSIIEEFENARKLVVADDEVDVLKHLQFSPNDIKYALTDMFFEDPEYQVILHGDCWNNNFLFKSSGDKTNPSEVRILDWQCSGLASPVFDLSHFIYSSLDTEKYDDVRELLKVYYDSFSNYLILLGCDPDTVFSFEKLIEHWEKFSRFGLLLSCWIIRLALLKEVPDMAEVAEQGQGLFILGPPDDPIYLARARSNFLLYSKNVKQ